MIQDFKVIITLVQNDYEEKRQDAKAAKERQEIPGFYLGVKKFDSRASDSDLVSKLTV